MPRGADGVMVPPPRPRGKWPTHQELHARKCFYLGITEPAKVARLWEAERKRVEALKAGAKAGRPRGRETVRKRKR